MYYLVFQVCSGWPNTRFKTCKILDQSIKILQITFEFSMLHILFFLYVHFSTFHNEADAEQSSLTSSDLLGKINLWTKTKFTEEKVIGQSPTLKAERSPDLRNHLFGSPLRGRDCWEWNPHPPLLHSPQTAPLWTSPTEQIRLGEKVALQIIIFFTPKSKKWKQIKGTHMQWLFTFRTQTIRMRPLMFFQISPRLTLTWLCVSGSGSRSCWSFQRCCPCRTPRRRPRRTHCLLGRSACTWWWEGPAWPHHSIDTHTHTKRKISH